MRIDLLTARGVRNLQPVQLEPRDRFNVFVGQNGQGKTNLLEAIYVVAAVRSFRTARLTDLLAFGGTDAQIRARVTRQDVTRVYEVEVGPSGRRILLDGKGVRPLAKYFGGFNVVVFTPEDLVLPRGSPGERRRFLDRAVFNQRPEYLMAIQDYEKVLKQRNSVLKAAGQGSMSHTHELLDVYDRQLAPLGVVVANARARFVETMAADLSQGFQQISRSPHRAGARYVSATADTTADANEARLRDGRAKDLATQATQHGPHRDDLAFELDRHDAGSFASQGQLRAIMLAWKTAELAHLTRVHADSPILLLDDVSSELDPARNEFLFDHLATLAGQCFITTTSAGHVLLGRDRADYHIENGQISS